MNGIIVKNISNDYTVEANGQYYTCKPRGLFRINNQTPLVGDNVVIDENAIFLLTCHHITPLNSCKFRLQRYRELPS